jgi:hypothetical protein
MIMCYWALKAKHMLDCLSLMQGRNSLAFVTKMNKV